MSGGKHELLKKEINEVKLLLEGIVGYKEIPDPILKLSIDKVDRLKQILLELQNGFEETPVQIPEEKAVPVSPQKVEEIIPEEKEEPKQVAASTEPSVAEEPEKEPVVEKSVQKRKIFLKSVDDIPFEEELEPTETLEPKEVIAEEKPVVMDAPKPKDKRVLADKLSSEKVVMNDVMGDQKSTLANKIEGKPIANIKKAIPINDRFRFQRDLFQNNIQSFNEALEKIETFSNFNEASDFLKNKYAWDAENTTAIDFMMLVERRFAN